MSFKQKVIEFILNNPSFSPIVQEMIREGKLKVAVTSPNSAIATKGVSFNLLDPDQHAQFEHAMKRPNFSAYCKRLIQRDLDGGYVVRQEGVVDEEEIMELNPDLMSSLV